MSHRGFTLIELILAIGITAVIGLSITTMMEAATSGITSKNDGRQSAIRIAATKFRLAAYIAPSRCVLGIEPSSITLWFDDNEVSNTVHATEIRWMQFNETINELQVKFVSFPGTWSQTQIDTANAEYSQSTDFNAVLQSFSSDGFIKVVTINDAIESCTFWANEIDPLEATQLSLRFSLNTSSGITQDALIDETIRLHQQPMEQQ